MSLETIIQKIAEKISDNDPAVMKDIQACVSDMVGYFEANAER